MRFVLLNNIIYLAKLIKFCLILLITLLFFLIIIVGGLGAKKRFWKFGELRVNFECLSLFNNHNVYK